MRWVFGVLVLANVALFMWGTWYRAPLLGGVPPLRPAVAAEKMKRVAEPGVQLTLRAQDPPPLPESLSRESRCYLLGPFATFDSARAAGRKLEASGLGYTRVAEFEALGPLYRVYLPPLASRGEARRKRRELTSLGFTDHALIQQEEGMENSISLGIFSVEQNARAHVERLARKGIEASIQRIPDAHPVYWLRLSAPAADDETEGTRLAGLNETDWGARDVTLRPAPCDPERLPGQPATDRGGRTG